MAPEGPMGLAMPPQGTGRWRGCSLVGAREGFLAGGDGTGERDVSPKCIL